MSKHHPISPSEFKMDRDKLDSFCEELIASKGRDYAGTVDVLTNFKVNAERFGLTPEQVLGIYMNKHFDAINSYIKSGGQNESEPIQSRIVDAVNYLKLLNTMIKAKETEEPELTPADIHYD